jgi:alpha-glucosidase
VTEPAAGRWWHDRVGYQVYLRSFADADGDGVGDLRGLHDRLEHLAWLGIGIVWVTPFYPSPMRDHGYDVADYRDVEPVFGDLDALDAVVDRAHALGMRVIVDLVPNHSSSDHRWFAAASSSPHDPKRGYYLWRDPAPDGGPPNNWASHFGGPAWTFDEASGQYWCHLFLPEQPDLNWRNPAIADEFDGILRFWLERGADGFRIDVAHAMIKHPDLPDLPPSPELAALEREEGPVQVPEHRHLDHVHDVDQPEVLDIYRRWRDIAEEHDAVLLGEVYLLEADRLRRYVEAQDGLHLSFWFSLLHTPWEPAAVRATLQEGATIRPGTIAWIQGSHDRPRAATRYGGGEVGAARSLAMATLLLGLPGVPFVYQGEELGLEDGEVPVARAQDPIALRAGNPDDGRDGCRTPMLWEPGPGWGFTSAEDAWLPFGSRTPADTVAVQRADPDALLHRFRALILWRNASATRLDGPVEWLPPDGAVVGYRRGEFLVVANCGAAPAQVAIPERTFATVVATNRDREGVLEHGWLALDPAEAVVLEREAG